MSAGTVIYGLPLYALGVYVMWTEWVKPYLKKGGYK